MLSLSKNRHQRLSNWILLFLFLFLLIPIKDDVFGKKQDRARGRRRRHSTNSHTGDLSRKSFFSSKMRWRAWTPLIRLDSSSSTHETSSTVCCLHVTVSLLSLAQGVRWGCAYVPGVTQLWSAMCVCACVCVYASLFIHTCEIDRSSCRVSCHITSISQKLTGDNEKERDRARGRRHAHMARLAQNLEICCRNLVSAAAVSRSLRSDNESKLGEFVLLMCTVVTEGSR